MYHIIEVAMRDGYSGYRLVKSFDNEPAMKRWVTRRGKTVWIAAVSPADLTLPEKTVKSAMMNGRTKTLPIYGEITAQRWNSGSGFVTDTMPALPYLGNK